MLKFWQKPWVNPFKKIQIFRLFDRVIFYSLERVVFSLEDKQTVYLGLF